MNDSRQAYFATLQGKDLGDAIFARRREYEKFVEQAGLSDVWRKMHWRYYGVEPDTGVSDHAVERGGNEGELHLLGMNHLRADVTLWLNLAAAQRTEMEPMALTDDYEAELEVRRAKAMLEHFNVSAGIEAAERLAQEYAGVYGMSYILRLWNQDAGPVIIPPSEGEEGVEATPEVRRGDLSVFSLTPMDCAVDARRRDADSPWFIARVWRNRFELAAKARDENTRQAILAHQGDDIRRDVNSTPVDLFDSARFGEGKDRPDEVACYYFIHRDTPAVPGGRFVSLLSENIILEDFALTAMYEEPPIKRLACAEIHRTPFGYSPAWGLLAPQEAQASLSSIVLSNARTFGLGTIVSPKGSDIDEEMIAEGLTLIEYTPGLEPPRPLQMPSTPQEVFAFRTALISEMGTLIGVNSVVRGDPEASLKSGSALALVQAQAVQFSSDFQAAIVVWKERHHFDTVSILQRNLEVEMLPQVAGNYQAALLTEFSGKDFKNVRKIRIKSVNPMSKTLAGKVQIADTLVERFPQVLTPGDYFRVLETGSIDYLTRGESQRRANLDRENELLSAGIGPKPPPPIDPTTGEPLPEPERPPNATRRRFVRALITDDHRAHILKHLEVLDNPAIRESEAPQAQKVIDAVLSHVEEHERLAVEATLQRLTLLELTNQPPLKSALPPPPPGSDGGPPPEGGEGGPPKKKGGDGGGPSPAAALQPEPAGANEMPRQPQMPVNPATGQRVEEVPGP